MRKLTYTGIIALISIFSSCSSGVENVADNLKEEVSSNSFSSWVTIDNEDGRFSVRLPGKPTQSSVKEPTLVGDIMIEMFIYEESSTQAFLVGYNDYPSGMFEGAEEETINSMLEGGVSGFTSSIGLNVVEEKEFIELSGHKGIYAKAKSTSNGYHVYYRAYTAGNRLYQVGIMRDGSYPSKEKSEAFFNSFVIND
ncbi:MAG: hypothetical protein ACK4K0_12330 [Flavobacteriales bacterium]